MAIKDFVDFLKLPPNILAAISLVSGFIILIPEGLADKLYMVSFRNQFGFIISIVFLITSALLVVFLITYIFKKIKKDYDDKKLEESRIEYLLDAESYKVDLIKDFLKEQTHTLTLQYNDGLTIELSSLGVISLAGNNQAVDYGWNNEMYVRFFLQPWVIKIINKDEKLRKKYKIKD